MGNPNVQDSSQSSIPLVEPTVGGTLTGIPSKKNVKALEKSDLEQSQAIAMMVLTPPSNMPALQTSPDSGNVLLQAMSSGSSNTDWGWYLLSQSLSLDTIKQKILDGWSNNIREIAEQVQMLLNSPLYQQQQEIRLKGDPQLGVVSGVESPIAGNEAAARQSSLQSYINSLQAFEKVPPSEKVNDPSAPSDASQAITIPLMAALFMGGAIAIGSFEMTTTVSGISSNPLHGVIEFVSQLQPLYPKIILDTLPTINLLVMPLIYFSSWDSSVGSVSNKEKTSNLKVAQKFAKSVIGLLSDPNVVQSIIAKKYDNKRSNFS